MVKYTPNDFESRICTRLPQEEIKRIKKEYKEVKFEGSFMDENSEYFDNEKYNWEMVVGKDNDEKYGRMMISRKYKLKRRQTMGEFYGSSPVD